MSDLWSAQQVADYLGATSTHSARHTLSSWGVHAVGYERGDSGRPEARYDAQQVRDAKASRPGRGRRQNPADA